MLSEAYTFKKKLAKGFADAEQSHGLGHIFLRRNY